MDKKESKKSKIRLYYDRFKELWGNPRGRAAILLGVYGLFLLFVVGGVRTNLNTKKSMTNNETQPAQEKKESKVSFEDMDNYEYDMKVTKNEEITLFQGKHYEKLDLFIHTGTNQAYYVEEGNTYQIINGMKTPLTTPLYNIDISKFTPEFIGTLLKEATLDYTTNYSTGVEKKNYILSVPAFMRLVYGTTVSSNEIITITTSMKNQEMQNVEIDLLGYERATDSSITKMMIEITYKNLGGVLDFHID